MDLFGSKGHKGMSFEITLPQIDQHELVKVVETTGKEVLRGLKNAKITNKTVASDGSIVYDLIYRHDEYGRRLVDNTENSNKFALFFGGGDLYGMGVARKDTIPSIFSRLKPEYKSYNYGFAGIGAQYPLRILETNNLRKEVKEATGVMIYVISEAHYPKTLGKFLHIYRPEMPDYKLVNGVLKYMGTFSETEPMSGWFKMVFGNSWLRRMMGDMNDYTSYTKEEHKLVCEIIKKTNNDFLAQFPESKFILMLHTNLPWIDRKELTSCSKENNIPLVDTFMDYDESKFDSDPVDGHPTAYLNELLVKKMMESL